MSSTPLKILIVGAGIAGPSLTYWLTRTKLDVLITIIERSPTPRSTGQSIDLEGLSVEIVKAMGLEEAIRSRNTTETGTQILNRSGKPCATFYTGDTFTSDYEILRADLAELLAESTSNCPSVHYRYGLSVSAVQQEEDFVDITFSDGSRDRYDLLVAADGTTSRTRSMIMDQDTLKDGCNFLGQYIAFFSVPRCESDTNLWQFWSTVNGRSAMLRPHRNPKTMGAYMCLTTAAHGREDPEAEKALKEGNDAMKHLLRQRFEDAGWQSRRIVDGMDIADDFYMSRITQWKLPKWTNKRALVLGDAAWATFGVGTSLAIEGAYYLAGELSKIQSSKDIPTALEQYEQTFRKHYAKFEDLPPMFPQIGFPQTVWGIRLRNSVAWLASKIKLHKLLQGGSCDKWTLPMYNWRD